MRHTREQHGSCFFSIFWICLRRRIDKIWCVSSRSPIWPFHFICVGRSGKCYQFFHVLPHAKNPWAPFWFLGRHEIFRSTDEVREFLVTAKRRSICAGRPAIVLLPCAAVWLIGAVPFTLAWAIYPWWWHARWLANGFWRRLKGLGQ